MKANNRFRAFMATGTLDHYDFKSLCIKLDTFKNCEFAIIIHDLDNGSPHLHISLNFNDPKTIQSVAKKLGFKPNFIEKWDKRTDNMWSYMVHNTKQSKGTKVRYDDYLDNPDKFYTNLENFKDLITTRKKHNNKELDIVISRIFDGSLNRKSLLQPDKIQFYHDNMRKLDMAFRLKLESLRYFAPQCCTIFISGLSGSGKTTRAVNIANTDYKDNYSIASSSNDILQDYYGEKCLIIDDFRPQDFPFIELLALLDPNYRQRTHKSRYFNKPLATELIIITSIMSLYDVCNYYRELTGEDMKQLRRRISIDTRLEQGIFTEYNYIENLDGYSYILANNEQSIFNK